MSRSMLSRVRGLTSSRTTQSILPETLNEIEC